MCKISGHTKMACLENCSMSGIQGPKRINMRGKQSFLTSKGTGIVLRAHRRYRDQRHETRAHTVESSPSAVLWHKPRAKPRAALSKSHLRASWVKLSGRAPAIVCKALPQWMRGMWDSFCCSIEQPLPHVAENLKCG